MVKNLLTLLSARQSSILSGASILMLAVFGSKFLGLVRDRLLVHKFDSSEAATFFAAFALPELLFNLLIFGALSVAFIPIFSEYLSKKGEKEAFEFASSILSLSLVLFAAVSLVAFIFIPQINSLIVPGFTGAQKQMTDDLSRIILLGHLVLLFGAFFVGINQSFQRFIIPSLAPLFYNLGMILGIIFLAPYFGLPGAALGVVVGATMHCLIQLPLINALGFKYTFSLNFFHAGVREVVQLMSFRNIGLIAEQINEKVSLALASLVSQSSVTLLTFSQHLQVVPIGLFGATIAQAALPVLSREKAQDDLTSFKITLLTTMHQILFLTLPAAAILIVLRIPVVRLVFGASQFSWQDTVITGKTVALFSLGLSAQSVILLLVRAFYALKDTRSPVMISLLTVALNIILSLFFILGLGYDVRSLGIAGAVATNISFVLLLYVLNKKVGGFDLYDLFIPGSKMFVAALISAVALYIPIKALDQVIFDTTKTVNLILLTGIASFFGLGVYLFLVWLMKVRELYLFGNLLKKVFTAQAKVKTQELVKETGTV